MAAITKNSKETQKFAESIAKKILKNGPAKKAAVLGLVGDLGAGKTTFTQGFARGLGIKEKILSPTFVILKRFQLNNLTIKQFNNFYHIDCYRIQKPKEILDLGWKEIINNPRNIVVIEWAEKIKNILPEESAIVRFKFGGKSIRKIQIRCGD